MYSFETKPTFKTSVPSSLKSTDLENKFFSQINTHASQAYGEIDILSLLKRTCIPISLTKSTLEQTISNNNKHGIPQKIDFQLNLLERHETYLKGSVGRLRKKCNERKVSSQYLHSIKQKRWPIYQTLKGFDMNINSNDKDMSKISFVVDPSFILGFSKSHPRYFLPISFNNHNNLGDDLLNQSTIQNLQISLLNLSTKEVLASVSSIELFITGKTTESFHDRFIVKQHEMIIHSLLLKLYSETLFFQSSPSSLSENNPFIESSPKRFMSVVINESSHEYISLLLSNSFQLDIRIKPISLNDVKKNSDVQLEDLLISIFTIIIKDYYLIEWNNKVGQEISCVEHIIMKKTNFNLSKSILYKIVQSFSNTCNI